MIVVSGGLVLLAIVLLVIGLIQGGLWPVYLSIGVSVVAGIFLLLGALQRRGETAVAGTPAGPGLTPASDPLERVTAVSVSRPAPAVAAEPAESDGTAGGGPQVAVVPGRPRYHTASCRFLAGRTDVENVALDRARGEGYTACGVCRPDETIAEMAEPEPIVEPELEAPEPAAAPAAARRTTKAAKPAAAKTATKAPAKTATKAAATKAAAAKPAAKAAAAKPAKATAATAAATRTGTVVVIPDRDKFHTETCRFVRDVPGAMNVSKATAKRQGYTPCGVCKP